MRKVYISSPFHSDDPEIKKRNIEYAKECMKDSIERGEIPFASHLLYPQVLNDDISEEREKGIEISLNFMTVCDKVIFYVDWGMSEGMRKEIIIAKKFFHADYIEYRYLGVENSKNGE